MCILEISFLTTISLNWISFVARPWWFFIKNAKFRSQNGFLSVWVILMYKRSSKIEFWNKIGSERQVIFKSILNSCVCLPWVDAGHNVPRSSDIFITFVFSFYSSFVSRNTIWKLIKKYKNGHFRAKIGVLGDWKFNWKIQLVMSRLYNQANENHYSIFWCFGTFDEGQKGILLVSFKVFED